MCTDCRKEEKYLFSSYLKCLLAGWFEFSLHQKLPCSNSYSDKSKSVEIQNYVDVSGIFMVREGADKFTTNNLLFKDLPLYRDFLPCTDYTSLQTEF